MLGRLIILSGALLLISHSALAQHPWYEGGTLQKAVVEDWNRATADDQLATSGDFIAALEGISDLSKVDDHAKAAELKKKAEDLRACVNQSINADTPLDKTVAELVVRCTVLKHTL